MPLARRLLALALALLNVPVVAVPVAAADGPAWRDKSLPVEARVKDLLARMTLEEKVAQLGGVWQRKAALQDEKGVFDRREGQGGARQRHRPGVAAERDHHAGRARPRTPRGGGLRQRGPEVPGRRTRARHPRDVPRGGGARLRRAGGDELPGPHRPRQHVGRGPPRARR